MKKTTVKKLKDSTEDAEFMSTLLSMSYDCYLGGEIHCGKCQGCIKRQARFKELGIVDKTVYKVRKDQN